MASEDNGTVISGESLLSADQCLAVLREGGGEQKGRRRGRENKLCFLTRVVEKFHGCSPVSACDCVCVFFCLVSSANLSYFAGEILQRHFVYIHRKHERSATEPWGIPDNSFKTVALFEKACPSFSDAVCERLLRSELIELRVST